MKEWGTQGRQHYKQRGDASSSGGFERCVEQGGAGRYFVCQLQKR